MAIRAPSDEGISARFGAAHPLARSSGDSGAGALISSPDTVEKPVGTPPIILVTCRDKEGVKDGYIPALRRAGWDGDIAVVSPDDPLPSFAAVAGVLLAGGADIHPRFWSPTEGLHPTVVLDVKRDEFEIAIVKRALSAEIPLFGICRGAQILNVAMGGSLIQDIPSQTRGDPTLHMHGKPEIPEVRHEVEISERSLVARLVGSTRIQVNSRHHQAIKTVARGLTASAWFNGTTVNGYPLIEAVESFNPRFFIVGVQWHPENLIDFDADPLAKSAALGLFTGFVEAAESFQRKRHDPPPGRT